MERGVFYEVSHAIAFAQMRRAVCQRQLSFLLSVLAGDENSVRTLLWQSYLDIVVRFV